ncbi:nusA N-terminal domain protein [Rhodococcus sp. MTM3W5.2]|nr:nusA N-terminal domain protein [Rhodococcus sp. MTM3W5.2]
MNIDIAALRAIEVEKGISAGTIIAAIQTALLTAYRHTEGHHAHARIDVDTKTGVVRVMTHDVDADGNMIGEEIDDTPRASGGSRRPPLAR